MIKSITEALARKRSELGQKEKGFTLIELLVVVIIIGILAAIAIPIFLGQQAQAKGSAVESAVANAKIDAVSAVVQDGTLPTSAELTTGAGDAKIALAIVGGATAFCISGTHTEVFSAGTTKQTWAADDTSGVVEGNTCSTTTFKVTTPTP